jgi:predicted nuclease of restriction endonuclease-like RecB superfamily
MLTSDLVRPRIKRRGSSIQIDLLNVSEKHWQKTAVELIRLFAKHRNKPYSEWAAALESYQGERVDYIVIRGLAKVLEDAATFRSIETPLIPSEVRERLFAHGPAYSEPDLFNPQTRADVLAAVAGDLKVSVEDIERALFADRPVEYLLCDVGPRWAPEALLTRYNLELARGVLYDASEMRVKIYDHYKDFWRYVKLFKLMFGAAPLPDEGYAVKLDGPISPFVTATRRYGRQFAAFLPALFLCERWQMAADIRSSHSEEPAIYALDHTSPLQSHFKRSGLFDSKLEEDFALEFEAKFGNKRGQWLLDREDQVLVVGSTVFIPDFSVTHKKDGRRALIELVGFWHPDYLRRKLAKVRAAGLRNLVLLVRESVNLTPEKLADTPGQVLYFPNRPVLKDVMAAIEACAQ